VWLTRDFFGWSPDAHLAASRCDRAGSFLPFTRSCGDVRWSLLRSLKLDLVWN
jgi:hypothetical protein